MKTRKNKKYGDYLARLSDREDYIDSLVGFWLGVETIEEACEFVNVLFQELAEAYDSVDQIAGVVGDEMLSLYTKEELVALATKAREHLNLIQAKIPETWQSSEFKRKKSL